MHLNVQQLDVNSGGKVKRRVVHPSATLIIKEKWVNEWITTNGDDFKETGNFIFDFSLSFYALVGPFR